MNYDNPIIEKLDSYGYFDAPDVIENCGQLNSNDRRKLSFTDDETKIAVRLYMEWFTEDLNQLCNKYHDRGLIIDGEAGPAFYELMQMPRCGHPDYLPAGTEEARFPDACRERITTSYKMRLSGLSESELEELWIRADQNWADVLNVDFELKNNSYPQTNIYAFEAALGGSVLADQYLSQGRCSDRLRGRFDNRTWSRALFLATCTHEHGHALGLGHLNDRSAIMYPSIHSAGMARGGTPNSSDINAMVRLGYRRRTSPPKPPEKPTGKVIAEFKVTEPGVYQIRSKTDNDGGWEL